MKWFLASQRYLVAFSKVSTLALGGLGAMLFGMWLGKMMWYLPTKRKEQ